MKTKLLYLDSAASSIPMDFQLPVQIGNASSRTHSFGLHQRKSTESARGHLANLMGVDANQIVFTSGATESIRLINYALPFTASSATSHNAMRSCVSNSPTASRVKAHFGCERVNNETGLCQSLAPESGLFTLDVTQSVAKIVDATPERVADFRVGSCHKFHGPLGVGFIVANDVDLWELLILPGNESGQERGIRPGTLNSPAIIQAGEVAKWMLKNGDEYRAKLKHLQSTFENKIKSLTDCWIIGAEQERAPHITSLNLPGVDNEALIASVNDRLAIASGSACTSEKVEPSHVLMAMFNDREIADTTVRISYGWFNTEPEVLEAAEIIAKAAETIRSFSL